MNEFLGKAAVRYAIIVCEHADQACPRLFPFAARTLHWPFVDPATAAGGAAAQLAAFRRVRDAIAARVREFVATGA
jgi:arsenate reductase